MNTSIATLRYRILDGPVSLEPLQVLQTRSIAWAGWTVVFSVLGASHAVSFSRGGEEFAEVLACASSGGPICAVLDLPGTGPSEPQALIHGVRIRGIIVPFALTGGDSLLNSYGPDSRLDRPFPAVDGRVPFTRIGWLPIGQTLVVETVHTYPEANVGIRTTTLFETGPAAQPGRVNAATPKEKAPS
jgi:hypothetical protein